MGRAEDIFNRICEKGEEAIKDFVNDRQSEDLFLEAVLKMLRLIESVE